MSIHVSIHYILSSMYFAHRTRHTSYYVFPLSVDTEFRATHVSYLMYNSKRFLVATVLVTRNFTKSDEFCRNSVRIPCGFHKASVQLTANCSTTSTESVSHFRGMILRCPRICHYKVNVFVLRGMSLLYTNMAYKLRTGSK